MTPEQKQIRWLFQEMRKQRVFVYRQNGIEIQLSNTAFEPKKPRVPRATPRAPEQIDPAISAPFDAFKPPWAAGIEATAPEHGAYDPTDPESPVDESALFGNNIPG